MEKQDPKLSYTWGPRVDGVAGFLSSRPKWLPPPLTRKGVLPPLWFQGDGTHSLAGEGAGGANSDEGTDTLEI